jgi:hypothetical protein
MSDVWRSVSVKSDALASALVTVLVKKSVAWIDMESHVWILSEIQSLRAYRGLESDRIDRGEIDQKRSEIRYPSI